MFSASFQTIPEEEGGGPSEPAVLEKYLHRFFKHLEMSETSQAYC